MLNQPAQSPISPQQLHALVLLVQEMFSQVDEVASLRRRGSSAQLSLLLLREMCAVLSELEPAVKVAYFDVLSVTGASRKAHMVADYGEEFAEHSALAKRQLLSRIRGELLARAA